MAATKGRKQPKTRKPKTRRQAKAKANPQRPARRVGKALAKYVKKATPKKAKRSKAKQPARRVGKSLLAFVRAQLQKASSRTTNGRRGRRNPGEDAELAAAAAMFEGFHGKPASSVREVSELQHSRTTLADLGKMLDLEVWPIDEDRPFRLNFKGVRLACSPDGGQLYFIGNQALDLAGIGLADDLPKDHVNVGEVIAISYHTSKAFHDFDPTDYRHEFGEEGGRLPMLAYDVLSEKFYLTGGSYQVKPEGIVN